MKLFLLLFEWLGKMLTTGIILVVCTSFLFIGYMGSQPMKVAQAPKGMTYWQFMSDRLDAAQTVQPARCGWGMLGSFFILGPVYSGVYTDVALDPKGFFARVTAPDPDIPKGVVGAQWYEVPGIWWNVVEHLSWTMLAKKHPACNMRPIQLAHQ
jgi:hypothetical protein